MRAQDHPLRTHHDGTRAYYANPAPLIDEDGTTTLLFRDFYAKAVRLHSTLQRASLPSERARHVASNSRL